MKGPRAIRWQLLAATLVSAGLLVAILIWDQARLTRALFYAQATEAARWSARSVATLSIEALQRGDVRTLRSRLRRLALTPDLAYIDLMDRERRVIASFTNTDHRAEGLPATRTSAREFLYEVQIPLESRGRQLGALRIGTNVSGLKAATERLLLRGFFIGLALLGLAAAIAWWFGHMLGARLWALTEYVRRLPQAAGAMPVGGNDEIAYLARTFN